MNAGGTLGGNGVVGNTTINGGTLAPGNSIGLLTVQGNLVFTAAATYMVEISPANADRTNVTGTAQRSAAPPLMRFSRPGPTWPNSTPSSTPPAASAAPFNPLVNTNLPANFKSSLSYDVNNVYLNLALLIFGRAAVSTSTSRMSAMQWSDSSISTGGIPSGVRRTHARRPDAGVGRTGDRLAAGDLRCDEHLPRPDHRSLRRRPRRRPQRRRQRAPYAEESGSYAYAAKNLNAAHDAFAKMPTKAEVARNNVFNPGWSVWGAPFGGGASTSGNAVLGSNNATVREFGFAAGADYRFSPCTLAGFALAGGGTNFGVNGSGSGRSDLFQAGVFVRHNVGAAYVTGALAYGWQDVTTDRTVTVAGVDRLRAEFKANAYSGRVEGGYRFVTPWMGITPYAAGQFTIYNLPAYAEQVLSGSNNFALNYAAKDVTASRTELGIRSDKSFAVQDGILTLRGRAAWAHDFNTDRSIAALFQTLPGAAFVVNGAALALDSALATASVEMKWLNGLSVAGTFEGEFSNVTPLCRQGRRPLRLVSACVWQRNGCRAVTSPL